MTNPIAAVGVSEAKARLSELLRRVEAGEEIEIRRGSLPIAVLSPIRSGSGRTFGYDIGRFTVPDDFNKPLPVDVLAAFER